jgi:endonuclease YncB( thermonuclease family)
MGLLKVTGTLSLDQFWPQGSSDADTTKVLVGVTNRSFAFQPHPGKAFRITRVFRKAVVRGKSGSRPPIDKKDRITVRLQGIDALELHYRASPLGKRRATLTAAQIERFRKLNKEYRQHFGETATVALKKLLSRARRVVIPCTVTTFVDSPNEVYDTYARFIGDIHVKIEGKTININRWLAQQGWAFPAFYNSMTRPEIENLLKDSVAGRRKKNRLWKNLQAYIGRFDFKLVFRGKGVNPDPRADAGPLIMPKLYRRLCTWSVYRKSRIEKVTYKKYIANPAYTCYITKDFLEQGVYSAPSHLLSDFLKPGGVFTVKPTELVFKEEPSRLVGANGKTVNRW